MPNVFVKSPREAFETLVRDQLESGGYEQEYATSLYFCHGVFIDRFIFRSNLL